MCKKLILILFTCANYHIAQTELDIEKFRLYPSSVTQTEPVAALHPLNNSVLFVSAVTFNTSNAFKSEGIYTSTDGGMSWTGSDTCNGALIFNHGGDPGVAITESGRLVLSHIGNIFPGMYAHYSDDMGLNWSNASTVTDRQISDKGSLTIDNSNQSNFNGRIYLAWTDVVSPYTAVNSYSSDDGITWSSPQNINPNPPNRCIGGSVATGSDGKVYICWAGITSTAPFREDYSGFASSTNGGETWNFQQNIFNVNGISGTLPLKGGIRVNGMPQIAIDKSGGSRNGWIYIVTTEFDSPPAGSDPDIILHYSSDGGSTWSEGIRVNQDEINNGKIQYFPFLEIDDEGNLNILFYDDRNTSSDSTDVFLSRSTDGGITWAEYSIKNSRFKPKPILGGSSAYQGDHIGLLAVENKLHAFWMADYSGIYQVWSVQVDLSLLDIEKLDNLPNGFQLHQNYPNPFNPKTVINYQLAVSSHVSLKVYDMMGKEIAVLVNEMKPVGKYEVNFDGSGLSSGMYIYQLKTNDFISSKKMILLK